MCLIRMNGLNQFGVIIAVITIINEFKALYVLKIYMMGHLFCFVNYWHKEVTHIKTHY